MAVQEAQLINQAQHGDVDSFNLLVVQYQDYIYTIAYRIMGEPASATDMTQDAFITAFQKIASFKGGSFRAWLSRIVTNTCYDELRRLKRRPATSFEELPGAESDDGPVLESESETPEETTLRHELSDAIQSCINGLSPDQKVVLVLCDVQGMAYQEASDTVGVNIGTIKSRLSRARQAVRSCLQAFQELLPAEYRLINE